MADLVQIKNEIETNLVTKGRADLCELQQLTPEQQRNVFQMMKGSPGVPQQKVIEQGSDGKTYLVVPNPFEK